MIDRIIDTLKKELEKIYGSRLKKVFLYGSWARNEATEDSDIDIMLVLDGSVVPGREIDRIIDTLTDINLEYGVLISIYPVSLKDFTNVSSPLLLNAHKEGTPV